MPLDHRKIEASIGYLHNGVLLSHSKMKLKPLQVNKWNKKKNHPKGGIPIQKEYMVFSTLHEDITF